MREKKKREGVQNDETKNYTSYCLLLLERSWTAVPKLVVWIFFPCCCCFVVFVCVSSFLVCAISMDSSKVDKCRIACSSCLSRGKKPKQNTHTRTARTHTHTHIKLQFPLFENALSTHIRQECFLIFFPPFLWLVFLRVWSETITTDALCSL